MPYLTFAGLLLVSAAFTALSLAYEKRSYADQDRHIDPGTGTWYADYDWRAENRKIELATQLRVWLLWVLVAHGAGNAVYASAVVRGWRGIALGLAFAVPSAVLAFILLVGGTVGPTMVG